MLRGIYISIVAGIFLGLFSFIQPNRDVNLRLKAMYVYKFAQYVDWPKDFAAGDFIIGVFGDERLYTEMQNSYSNKMIGNQTVKIKKFGASSEVVQCHILFVADKYSDKIPELSRKYKSKSTLIVSEKDGKLRDGSVFNFLMKDGKLKYEVSKTNADRHKLTVGQLLITGAYNIE